MLSPVMLGCMAARRAEIRVKDITRSILVLRGQRVILDRDLAAIYGVATKVLNQAVKRNSERFPRDFRFQLTSAEAAGSRSQFVTLNLRRGQNIKFLPYAFTEHGAIQAANVLNSPRAIAMGVYVVRAFVRLRKLVASNTALSRKLDELERKYRHHDEAITAILSVIRKFTTPSCSKRRGIGFTANIE